VVTSQPYSSPKPFENMYTKPAKVETCAYTHKLPKTFLCENGS